MIFFSFLSHIFLHSEFPCVCRTHLHASLGIRIFYAMLDLVCASNVSAYACLGQLWTWVVANNSGHSGTRNTSWQPSNVHHCLAPTVSPAALRSKILYTPFRLLLAVIAHRGACKFTDGSARNLHSRLQMQCIYLISGFCAVCVIFINHWPIDRPDVLCGAVRCWTLHLQPIPSFIRHHLFPASLHPLGPVFATWRLGVSHLLRICLTPGGWRLAAASCNMGVASGTLLSARHQSTRETKSK